MDVFFTSLFLGQPVWMWLGFLALVITLLAFDLGVLNRGSREVGARKSLILSGFYITVGVAFAGFVWAQMGSQSATEYLTGFFIEKSLALDNIFVIALIFSSLAIPRQYQYRVLFWGILGVIVLRAIMIGFGAAIVAEYAWVLYIFAAFLIFTGFRMLLAKAHETDFADSRIYRLIRRFVPVTDKLHGSRFIVREPDAGGRLRRYATPLLVALLMVEMADIVFAVDSIPAIFAITTDPFIVYTSNIFAILGLRAMYFLLAGVVHKFRYLKYGLGLVLVFVGLKMVWLNEAFGGKFPITWSLGIIAGIIGTSVAVSLLVPARPAGGGPPPTRPG